MRVRISPFTLALVLAGTALPAWAQAPAAPAPSSPADPTKRNVPAEIVPAKPAELPAPGEKTTEAGGQGGPVSPGSAAPAAQPVPPLRELVDALPEAEIDRILQILRTQYVAPGALSDAALKRATLQGVLERLQSSASLFPAAPPAAQPAPFVSEVLAGAGYVRLGTLTAETVTQLDAALAKFAEQKLGALILDLRTVPAGMNFELAAEVAQHFCGKGQFLFTVQGGQAKERIFTSKGDAAKWSILTVLVDADTAGTAELVAATLRALAKAVVIGQPTRGEAAEFAAETLGSGRVLRYAVAEAKLPGGLTLVPGGMMPDIPVAVAAEENAQVLAEEQAKGLAPLLQEPDRPRMNEAALVAGATPEIDAIQAAQGKPKAAVPLRDATLQRAVDLITSLRFLEKAKK